MTNASAIFLFPVLAMEYYVIILKSNDQLFILFYDKYILVRELISDKWMATATEKSIIRLLINMNNRMKIYAI